MQMNTTLDFYFRPSHQCLRGDGEEGLWKVSIKHWLPIMTRAAWSWIVITSKTGIADSITQMQKPSLHGGEWLVQGLRSKLVSGRNGIGNQVCLESRAQMAFTALWLLPLVRKVCAHRDVPVEATSHGSRSLVSWWKGKVGREKGEVLRGGSEENTHHFWALPCHVWTEHCTFIRSSVPSTTGETIVPVLQMDTRRLREWNDYLRPQLARAGRVQSQVYLIPEPTLCSQPEALSSCRHTFPVRPSPWLSFHSSVLSSPLGKILFILQYPRCITSSRKPS